MPEYVDNPNNLQIVAYISPVDPKIWQQTVDLQSSVNFPNLVKFTFQYDYLNVKTNPITSYLQYRLKFPVENGFINVTEIQTCLVQKEPVIVQMPELSWFDLSQYQIKLEVKKTPYDWVYRRSGIVSDQLWGLKIEQFI